MGMLSNAQLLIIGDKLSRWATEAVGDPEFNAGFTAGLEKAAADVLSGAGGIGTYLLTLNDEDIEADLLPAARDLDENHPTLADGFLLTLPEMKSMISALNKHYTLHGFKGVDDYLTSQNAATPTLRMHGHFKKYLKTIAAKNSFIPNDLDIAAFTETGATAGTLAHLTAISPTQFGGAKFVVKNVTALTTNSVVTVTAKKWDGTVATLTATLSVHTIGHETDLSDTTMSFVDVTAITVTTGTNADQFKIVAKTDRDISAA